MILFVCSQVILRIRDCAQPRVQKVHSNANQSGDVEMSRISVHAPLDVPSGLYARSVVGLAFSRHSDSLLTCLALAMAGTLTHN